MAAPEHIANLLFRNLRKELTVQEVEELQAWRRESPEQEQLFQQLTNEEALPGLLKAYYDRREMVWNKIVAEAPELATKRTNKLWWQRTIAAAAILLFAIGATYWLMKRHASPSSIETINMATDYIDIPAGTNRATLTLADGSTLALGQKPVSIPLQGNNTVQQVDSGSLQYGTAGTDASIRNTLSTPRGGQYQVVLPDGTRVWLNAASSLTYPTSFPPGVRPVELTGEAYFEVAKNPSSPFTVKINQKAELKVLGTHFNVMAYTDEASIVTDLLEGSVKFQDHLMQVSERALLRPDGVVEWTANSAVEESISWTRGTISFSDADIPAIMRIISRWYDIDIVYAGPKPVKQLQGGIPRNAPLSDVLKVLTLYDIHYTLDGKTLVIRP